MRHIKRNKKGQYTKRHTGRTLFILGIIASIGMGTYLEIQKTVVPEVEAHVVATTTPDQIVEIVAVPNLSPTEVGLWFMDSNVELLKAFRDGDYEKADDILKNQSAYVTAVAIKTYDADTK
jgi:hypothetical protein